MIHSMLFRDLRYLDRMNSVPLDLVVLVAIIALRASATIAFEQLRLHQKPSKVGTVCKLHLQLLSQVAVVLAV